MLEFPWGKGAGVAIASGVFDPALIEKLYLFSLDAWSEVGLAGRTVGGLDPDVKHTTDINFSTNGWEGDWTEDALREVGYDLTEMDKEIAAGVKVIIDDYTEEINPRFDGEVFDTGYLIQRYERGEGHYIAHSDSTACMSVGRQLAIVIYLNDVEEGGETFFPLVGAGVRPVAGTAAVFPALWTHPHIAQVPLSGDKYIISTFVCADINSMIFEQR